MNNLESIVFKFLEKHLDPSTPVLIGLSGGPDSLALFHVLLKYKNQHSLQIGIAHIDHGWRLESGKEAAELAILAKQFNLPFYSKRLNVSEIKGNLESACRIERISFFTELCQHHGYQAVILGHHNDDQTETILKKIFEGNSLPYLGGIKEVSKYQKLTIWRPLLTIKKQEILDWLNVHNLSPFEDPTNLDSRFLRGRMRTSILPLLAEEFGKNITKSLNHISQESCELNEYLDEKIKPYLNEIVLSQRGSLLNLENNCPNALLEIKHLVRKMCECQNLSLSQEILNRTSECILNNCADKKFSISNKEIYVDRRRIFLISEPHNRVNYQLQELKLGGFDYFDWTVSTEIIDSNLETSCNWENVWNGNLSVCLPADDYYLGSPILNAKFHKTSLSHWWTSAKVPAFLRYLAPVLWTDNDIYHEFLTGKTLPNVNNSNKWITIHLSLTQKN